jgi:solute carrier family 35 protein E3
VQWLVYKQSVTKLVQLTLMPILFGVGYATVYDLSLNMVGCIFAVCAIVATSMAQIFTNTYQKSLDCNAMQLLYHTSPLIAIGMLIMSPFFDDWGKLWVYQFSQPCVLRIFTSCVFALGVNISNYLVLGKTSPLTYQVLGHLKTILILFWGFTVFKKAVDLRNVIGIAVALIGVIAYTEVRRREVARPVLPTRVDSK